MASPTLLHRAAHGVVAEVLEEVASQAVVARNLAPDQLDPALLGLLLRFLHQQPAVVLSARLARHAQRGHLKRPGPVAGIVALCEPEMAEVAAVVPFQDPELRAGAAKAVPAEPHLHVEKGGKALLEDGALLLRRIAEAVELRLHLQRGELLPILRGVWAQARHGRVLAKCGPAFKLGLASVLSFRLKGPSGSEGEVVARKKGRGTGSGAGPQQQKPAGVAAGGGGWGLLRDSIRRDVEQAISALAFAERLHQKVDTQRRAFLDFPRIMEQLRSGAVERLTTSLSRLYEGGQGFDLQRFLRDLPLALAQLAA